MAQYTGVVKWFNNAKDFGFLGRDVGTDMLVHYNAIQLDGYKSLRKGDQLLSTSCRGTQESYKPTK